jgi:hypothetical protein
MAGGSGPRNMNSRYQRAHEERPRDADADVEEGSSGAAVAGGAGLL